LGSVSLSLPRGKFWGYEQYQFKSGSALNFSHICPHPPHHTCLIQSMPILQAVYIIFWAAQTYLDAAQTHFWRPIIMHVFHA
jgi:hypothetical protein